MTPPSGGPQPRADFERPQPSALQRLLPFLGTVLGSTLLATLLFHPWGGRVATAMSDGFDVRLHELYVRNILGGNLYYTDQLGAPFGQHLADFAIGGERINLLGVRFLGLFTDNVGMILNIFFLSTFPIISGVTYLVARKVGIGVRGAIVVAVLFTFLPFHFAHGVAHPFLANYVALPFTILLATWAIQGRIPSLSALKSGAGQQRRDCGWLVLSVIVAGSGGQYFAAFSVLIVAGATLLSMAAGWDRRRITSGGITAAALLSVLAINNIPEILWRHAHGTNAEVGTRGLLASQHYGMQLAQLVLPGADGRITPLARLGGKAAAIPFPGEPGSYIGLVSILGIAGAIALMMRQGTGRRVLPLREGPIPLPLALAFLTLFCAAMAVVGGLNIVFGVVVTPQLRSWDRMAPYIALMGLLAAAWIGERLDPKHLRSLSPVGKSAFAGLVLVVGLFDLIPTNVAPSNTQLEHHLEGVRSLVRGMDQTLPAHAQVFQLPVTTFPEAGPTRDLPDYSLLEPYLSTPTKLRWSYGGLRGREGDWQLSWGNQPLTVMLRGIANCGFDALYVDRRGFLDRGAAINRALADLGISPADASADGTLRWYDLRPLRQRRSTAMDRACQLILHGVVPRPGPGFLSVPDPRPGVPRWMEDTATVNFDNPLPRSRRVIVRLRLRTIGPGTITLTYGGRSRTFSLRANATNSIAVPLLLAPGANIMRLATTAPIDLEAPTSDTVNAFTARVAFDQIRIDEERVRTAIG